jgi:hypothetical protein
MGIGLGFKQEKDESPYETGLRMAKKYGMEAEFKEFYERFRKSGDSEAKAAWSALYEWDLLEVMETPDV